MKKGNLLLVLFLAIFMSANAQIVFQENFNTTADGALPTGWTRFNVDGLTPYTDVNFCTDAWVCKLLNTAFTTKAAWSTSYYTPAGVANDWMFTPAIVIPATYPVLQFTEYTPNTSYPDGYELRIMTVAPTLANLMTSTVLSTVAAASTVPLQKNINLSAYAGQTVYIGWRNNSNDKVVLGIDDIAVKSLPANGISITSINVPAYVQVSTPHTIAGVLNNTGGAVITNFNLNYSIDGGAAITQNITGLNIAALANYNYSHSTIWNAPATQGTFSVKVWASNINGISTLNSDTITKVVNTLTTLVFKKVVLEEYTGIHCGYCPDGHKKANLFKTAHPNDVILINIHEGSFATPGSGEPDYTTSFGTALSQQTELTGYPSGTINRHVFAPNVSTALNRGEWSVNGLLTLAEPTYVTLALTASINASTRLLTVNTTADYLANGPALNMINVALLQNNVEGPQTNGSTNPSQMLPNGKYNHGHMLRHMLTGQWGDSVKVTTIGTSVQRTYTYTLPASIKGVNLDINNLEVVAFIAEGKQEIITGAEFKIQTSVEEINNVTNFEVYPNPAKDNVQLNFNLNDSKIVKVSVYNTLGAVVFSQNEGTLSSGNHTIDLNVSNLSSGIYYMNIKAGDNTITKKLIIE